VNFFINISVLIFVNLGVHWCCHTDFFPWEGTLWYYYPLCLCWSLFTSKWHFLKGSICWALYQVYCRNVVCLCL